MEKPLSVSEYRKLHQERLSEDVRKRISLINRRTIIETIPTNPVKTITDYPAKTFLINEF